jgi:mannose-6-phosphate isomerase-like protein (cupin superfamily)
MKLDKVNLIESFDKINTFWSPNIGGDIGNYQVKLAKFKGEFHWHHHDNEDELFLVTRGILLMKLQPANGGDITVNSGEFIIVPKGIRHCPVALSEEVHCVLLEPNTTLNTGDVFTENTVRNLQRLW